jgi:hypothetical protein
MDTTELISRIDSLEARIAALEAPGVVKKPKHYTPTVPEITAYGATLEPPLPAKDAQHFFDHFSSNGWKVGGKAAMKDWQASVRNWHRNWQNYKQRKPYNQPVQDDVFDVKPAK